MAGMSGTSPYHRRTDVAELRRHRRPHSADVLPRRSADVFPRVATSPALLRRRNTAETPSPRGAATPSPRDKAWCLRRVNSEVLPTFHFHETGRLRGHGSARALGTAFLGSASPAAAREGERRSRRARRTGAFAFALAGALAILLVLGSASSRRPEPGPEHDAPSAWEESDSPRKRRPPRKMQWQPETRRWSVSEPGPEPGPERGSMRGPERAASPARGESEGRRTQGPPREAPQPPDALLRSPRTPRRAAEEGAEDGAGPGAGEDLQEADNDYDYGEEGDNDYDYGQEGDNDYDYGDYDYGHE